MNRKTIVLADSSYTIRRIVELSFSDEADIQLVTFENGVNLKEKLFELRPQIVLVDIKLPGFNGYDVCKFIQGTDGLKQTKVFLLKGGFEPIDEALLDGLKYENIITKPFDSNALVANIKKLLEKMPVQAPSPGPATAPYSLPEDEDLSEIESFHEPEKEISFSDVKEEIDAESMLVDEDELVPVPGAFSDDEILPSEEITRAQPDKDTISPGLEEDDNPFADEMPGAARGHDKDDTSDSLTEEEMNIRRNIELQEKELEIDSLTLEEINIKRDIERRERTPQKSEPYADMVIDDEGEAEEAEEEDVESDTADMFPESKLESTDDFFSYEKEKAEPEIPEPPDFSEAEDDMFAKKELEETEIPDIRYEHELERESLLDMDVQHIEDSFPPKETPAPKKMEKPEAKFAPQREEIPDEEDLRFGAEKETAEEALDFAEKDIPDFVEEDIPGFQPSKEFKMPEFEAPPAPKPKLQFEPELEPELEIPAPKPTPKPKPKLELEPELEPELEIPAPPKVPKAPPKAAPISEEIKAPKPPTPPAPPAPEMRKIPEIPTHELLGKIEDKLTHAIKEMLWEIVPLVAEKIIKEEIDSLKIDTENLLKE